MRFKAIYDTLRKHDCRIKYDGSDWQKGYSDSASFGQPLWIVAEATRANKRLWIIKQYGRLSVTTAKLELDDKSREYGEPQTCTYFRTQAELKEYLERLLEDEAA
jgi:hypothetical protein